MILTHILFTKSMTALSFSLMRQVSAAAFHQVDRAMDNAEVKSKSTAQLIKLGVVDIKNEAHLISYTENLMQREIELFPIVQAVLYGDPAGNLVIAEQDESNHINSDITRRNSTSTRKIIYRDTQGNVTKTVNSTDFSFDPRNRPWYQAAIKEKKSVWLDVYPYFETHYLGISVATPAYSENGKLIGVIDYNIRLDYLRNMVERVHLSQHGVLFIVTANGDLIAYPKLIEDKHTSLVDIHKLSSAPWLGESFDLYKKTGKKEFIFRYANESYLASYQTLIHFGKHVWFIGAIVPQEDFIGEVRKTHFLTLLLSLLILILGVAAVSNLVTRVVKPLKKITEEIDHIKNFDLDNDPKIHSQIKEINYIADALNAMKKGLRSFQKYVPSTLVRQLIETGEVARIGGTKKPLVIFFSDIKDFSSLTEHVDPDSLSLHLCQYFEELTSIIVTNRGTIDKYIGDSLMAFWGAPLPETDPAKLAARAALRCIKRLRVLNNQWELEGKPAFITRIGIHLGEAIVGNLGSSERLNYTIIGNPANIASRLEQVNKRYGTNIIVSEDVYHAVKNQFILRMIDRVIIKGKVDPIYIYELIAESHSEVGYDIDAYNKHYQQGFVYYQNKQWNDAIECFLKCRQIYRADTIAPLLINRCEQFKMYPPPKHWNGAQSGRTRR
ncbi:MAG: adenylate/guanylate cyclase domain-containing protein [Gammaproteobacteria bacterium]